MTTTRIPFQNVAQTNKEQEKQFHEKSDKLEKQEKVESVKADKSKINFDESLDNLDKKDLIQSLKLHKQILKTCFEENDQLRDRIAYIEAKFSALQDEIEKRDNVIIELSDLVEQLQNQQLKQ